MHRGHLDVLACADDALESRRTAITILMTCLFLSTNGSVLLAVLAHLTFNTAESVLFGGLPRLAPATVRAVYITNVGVLASLSLVGFCWLATLRNKSLAA